jgi:hypothetical protein
MNHSQLLEGEQLLPLRAPSNRHGLERAMLLHCCGEVNLAKIDLPQSLLGNRFGLLISLLVNSKYNFPY